MASTITSLSTERFAACLDRPDHNILDVRPMAAYNGWRVNGTPRGGHVPGARSIPYQWTQFMDWVEVPEEKDIQSETPITIYGDAIEEVEEMADNFRRLGFDSVSIYTDFRSEWAADPDRPLRHLERYRQLVSPDWLKSLLHGADPEGYGGDDYVVCHAHFDHLADYENGHIPGAIPLNTKIGRAHV